MNQRPDDRREDDLEPGEYRPDYRVVDDPEEIEHDPDDLRFAEPSRRETSWRDLIDQQPESDHGDGAIPPDEYDWDREEGDDYGARWLAGAGRLLAILALLGLLVPLLTVFFPRTSSTVVETPLKTRARVLDVVDGNTITVQIQGRNYTVELIGVDIPDPADEFYGLATQSMSRWVNGRFVELEADDQNADADGHLLRYVWVDNVMVNASLIANGLARSIEESPNDRYFNTFTVIEEQARSRGRGIWDTGGRSA